MYVLLEPVLVVYVYWWSPVTLIYTETKSKIYAWYFISCNHWSSTTSIINTQVFYHPFILQLLFHSYLYDHFSKIYYEHWRLRTIFLFYQHFVKFLEIFVSSSSNMDLKKWTSLMCPLGLHISITTHSYSRPLFSYMLRWKLTSSTLRFNSVTPDIAISCH